MKPNSEPSDPYHAMLTDGDGQLPVMAARAAREYRARRRRQRRQFALVILLGVSSWITLQMILPAPKGGELARNTIPPPAPAPPGNFVITRTMEEAISKPLPPPPQATEEQKKVLESARGLPLLVVMDRSGNPARIVVLER